MNYFSIIKDSDIFENPAQEPEEYIERPTVKAIIVDNEKKVATYYIHGRNLFPGGGVEEGETNEEALVRECKEEIGCDVIIESSLGTSVEFRAKVAKKYVINFYVAKVIKKGTPTTTQDDELGMVINWLPNDETLSILKNQIATLAKDVYMPHFACRTHLAAFKKYLEEGKGEGK